jgi:glycosyltransferase involved in cell wall biosynthesis
MTSALRELGGIDVEIATTDADGASGRLTAADLPDRVGTVHLFERCHGETLKHSRSLDRWLNAHAGDYDVIQVHSIWNAPTASACRAARLATVPYIIRPCGMLSDFSWRSSRWKKRAYWWVRERGNVRHAAAFHVTSDGERQEVVRLGVTAPVEIIPLGIGSDAWDAPVESGWLRERCPQAGRRPIVLYLSRIHPKKGLTDFLLPALAKMKIDAFLAVVGGEDDHAQGYTRIVEQEIIRLGLEGRVTLLGPISAERRWAAYDGADLFVLPSHAENFGIVVAEAMARSKAVVITSGVQFAEHVVAGEAGAIVRPDIDELAIALDLWLEDHSRRTRAGESGRRYIRDHFTWRRTAVLLADLYERLCGPRKQDDNGRLRSATHR